MINEISSHVDGSIAVGGETDWIKVVLKQNQRVDFGFDGSGDLDKRVGGKRNIVIAGIYDSNGVAAINPPKESDGTPGSYTFFNPLKEDEFYVKLQARDTSLTGSYRFGVTPYEISQSDDAARLIGMNHPMFNPAFSSYI